MDKIKINYAIDALLAISFLVMAVTGVIKHFTLFGFRRADLMLPHDISGIIFVVLAIIHLALHYNWIIAVTKNLFKKKDEEE